METENISEFISLKDHEDYEILTTYPHTIRRKDNHHEIKENIENGYVRLMLKNKHYLKHRLIALQFIENDNPEIKTQVDHKNRNRTDNHISNLRWVSVKENQMNKASSNKITYTYTNIPNDSLKITDYNTHIFESYYYYENNFYFYNGVEYRKLHINEKKNGYKFVNMMSIKGKKIQIYLTRFKKIYDLN